ncbi:type II/IV secretion system protein [Candidatus Daviesbacteria bacterium]|nr:type II/IV secretion system protein [Candidatus Daviesbacteria bacterium]
MATTQLAVEDVLFQQGLLKTDQVSAIKLESINSGQPTEKIILEHRFATPENIARARSIILGVPFIQLEGKGISAEVSNLIPEPVAKRYKLIPFEKSQDKLFVAMADPFDLQVIQFIEKKSGHKVIPYLADVSDILKAITTQYSQNLTSDVTSALREVAASQIEQKQELDQAEVIREAPVANIVTQLLEYAVKSKASDIHVEPMENQTRVRYRIDGILHEKIILPKKVHDAVVSRIKILAHLKIDERRLPQDGRFSFEFAGTEIDLRISSLPTVYGEKIVLRLLPKSQTAPTLPELGLRGGALKSLQTQILRPHGIILICGPTGSGKTTTLYSILSKTSTTKVNVLTIEDPVEYQIPGVNQVQVNPTIGLTFASALRSFLRQDPNVILVGEIRDTETAELAIQAALTGHQVFSTLHTNSASGALPRLLDMGTEPFLLASAVNGIVGQRILRKICEHCKLTYTPPVEVVENIKQTLGNLLPNKPFQLFKSQGCEECGHTGYSGRTGIYEVLVVNEKITKLILERSSTGEIEQQSRSDGMITLKQDGYLKAIEGITTLEEVLRVAQD